MNLLEKMRRDRARKERWERFKPVLLWRMEYVGRFLMTLVNRLVEWTLLLSLACLLLAAAWWLVSQAGG